MPKPIIISLGGSLIVPDEVDIAYLKRFKRLILSLTNTHRFIIVTGGGAVARAYVQGVGNLVKTTARERDLLGITATRLNGELLRLLFKEKAHDKVIIDPTKKENLTKPITIAAGYQPGASSDHVAVLLAKTYGAKTILNLSNTDYIYTADPKKDPQAKACKRLRWSELQKIVGTTWIGSGHFPFDPIATKKARTLGVTLYALNGKNLNAVKHAIEHKPFKGTIVER